MNTGRSARQKGGGGGVKNRRQEDKQGLWMQPCWCEDCAAEQFLGLWWWCPHECASVSWWRSHEDVEVLELGDDDQLNPTRSMNCYSSARCQHRLPLSHPSTTDIFLTMCNCDTTSTATNSAISSWLRPPLNNLYLPNYKLFPPKIS